jgi:hypothetical protein
MPIIRSSRVLYRWLLPVVYTYLFFSRFRTNFVVCLLLGDSPGVCILYADVLEHSVPAYEDGTECSETSAYKFQTPGNHPKESIQHSVHGESLKSRTNLLAENHSIIRAENRFALVEHPMKFLFEIITVVSSANNMVSAREFILNVRSFI